MNLKKCFVLSHIQEKIAKLQVYYTKAIRDKKGCTPEEMEQSIMASFYHCTSSDDWPKHQFCPSGPDSWCFFKRAEARSETPGKHADHLTCYINPVVAKAVRETYKRLSDHSLMERCVDGLTQNSNESFHNQIWLRCPKHIWMGRQRIEMGLGLAICEWNRGAVGLHAFMDEMSMKVNSLTVMLGKRRDALRIKYAVRYVKKVKANRARKRLFAQRREEQRKAQEIQRLGAPAYAAGCY